MLIDSIIAVSKTSLEATLKIGGKYSDYALEQVYDRDMAVGDPTPSAYVIQASGEPAREYEIGQYGPTSWSWYVMYMVMVKSVEESLAMAARSRLLWRIVRELYRTSGLQGELAALSETGDGVTERMERMTLLRTDLYQGKEGNSFIYLGSHSVRFDTELTIS